MAGIAVGVTIAVTGMVVGLVVAVIGMVVVCFWTGVVAVIAPVGVVPVLSELISLARILEA